MSFPKSVFISNVRSVPSGTCAYERSNFTPQVYSTLQLEPDRTICPFNFIVTWTMVGCEFVENLLNFERFVRSRWNHVSTWTGRLLDRSEEIFMISNSPLLPRYALLSFGRCGNCHHHHYYYHYEYIIIIPNSETFIFSCSPSPLHCNRSSNDILLITKYRIHRFDWRTPTGDCLEYHSMDVQSLNSNNHLPSTDNCYYVKRFIPKMNS